MFNTLFSHIKSHKGWYIGLVGVLLVVVVMAYGAPNGSDGVLTGSIRHFKTVKQPLPPKITEKIKPINCTEAAWECTEFQPSMCPDYGIRSRICTLIDNKCANSDAVKPAERESCVSEVPVSTLTAVSEGNPDAINVVAGASQVLVAKYRFSALREGFNINKMTIINDATAAFDTAVVTTAINQVAVKYPDVNGITQSKSTILSGSGSATFSNLDFYVPDGEDVFVEIYASINTMAMIGQSLSGQTFRLGIQDTGNTASTFEAVGQSSASIDYFVDGNEITNATTVNTFVVRKTKPTFAKTSGLTSMLINGENRLYGITVTADNGGSVGLARLIFDVNTTDIQLNDFKFYRGSTVLDSDHVNIHDGNNDIGLLSGNAMTGNKVIVSFSVEETVAAGSSQTYYLDATAIGAISNSTIATKLASSDSTVITGEQLYPSFMNTLDNNRNILWSDKSADLHSYPTIQNGDITYAGSSDWTNGYLLKVNELASHTLMH